MAKSSEAAPLGAEQSMEQLQERYRALDKRKTQAETNLENAARQLETLQAEARAQYGTDDLDKLRAKLVAMKIENEEKRKNYQQALDKIDGELSAVDAQFAAAENPAASTETT